MARRGLKYANLVGGRGYLNISVLDPFECIRTRCFVNTRLYSVYSLRVSFDDRDRYLDKDRRGEAARFYNRGCPA